MAKLMCRKVFTADGVAPPGDSVAGLREPERDTVFRCDRRAMVTSTLTFTLQ